MITGAHMIIYSTDPEADRAFLREILGFPYVDVGHGWLIFGLPPSELAVHPAEKNNVHEFILMCDDVDSVHSALIESGTICTDIEELRWGRRVSLTLPGGGDLSVYQPFHERPASP